MGIRSLPASEKELEKAIRSGDNRAAQFFVGFGGIPQLRAVIRAVPVPETFRYLLLIGAGIRL